MALRWPWKLRRTRILDLALALVLIALAVRAILAVLPAPLQAERRRARVSIYVTAAPGGLREVLVPGERVWCARDGVMLGRIIRVEARPASAAARPAWDGAADLLVMLSVTGRYQAGRGLYLDRNLAVRVGETYPLRSTLGAFWGRVERISLAER